MFHDPSFWVLVAFAITVGLLARKVYGAAVTAIDGRTTAIRARIDQAAKLREEAQALLAAHQRKQREAEREARDLLAHARSEAEELKRLHAGDLDAALARRRQQARDKIARAEADALRDVQGHVVALAVRAARDLITRGLDDSRQDALLDRAIADLPRQLTN